MSGTSRFSSSAAWSDLVSFHNKAFRITFPSESRATIPCCWPPIEMASILYLPTSSRALSRARCHSCGSTSVPSGCGREVDAINSPESASRNTTLTDWVDESTPATILGIVLVNANQIFECELIKLFIVIAAFSSSIDIKGFLSNLFPSFALCSCWLK